MHGKGEFAKIKGSICNIPIETANACNSLPRAADSIDCGKIKTRSLSIEVMFILSQCPQMSYTRH